MKYKLSPKKGKNRIYIILILLLILILLFYLFIENNIKPKLIAISEIKARLFATQAINDAVSKKIELNSFNDLIFIKTDNTGKVSLVQANTKEMNRLAVETSKDILRELEDIKRKEIKISIGNIMGSQIFADMGPQLNVNIQPAGSVDVNFTTEFIEAGINQTRLKIYMAVSTKVQIIIPFAGNKVDVSANIPVSETIIVGDVPESYINVPKDNNDFLKVAPTKDPFKD